MNYSLIVVIISLAGLGFGIGLNSFTISLVALIFFAIGMFGVFLDIRDEGEFIEAQKWLEKKKEKREAK